MKSSTLAVTTAWGMILPFTQAASHADGHVYEPHRTQLPQHKRELTAYTQRDLHEVKS